MGNFQAAQNPNQAQTEADVGTLPWFGGLVGGFTKWLIIFAVMNYFSAQRPVDQNKQPIKYADELEAHEQSSFQQASSIQAPLQETQNQFSRVMNKLAPGQVMPNFRTVDSLGRQLPPHKPLWPQGQQMDLFVYLSTDETFFAEQTIENSSDLEDAEAECSTSPKENKGGSYLIWAEYGLVYDYEPITGRDRHFNINVSIPESTRNNGSLYAHVFLAKKGVAIFPDDPSYEKTGVAYKLMQLNRYRRTPKKKGGKNLILEEDLNDKNTHPEQLWVEDLPERTVVNYWKPQLTINAVHLFMPFTRNQVPPPIQPYMDWDLASANFYPIVYHNDFWLMNEHLIPINDTTSSLPLSLSYDVISWWKFQLMITMESQWSVQTDMGLAADGESDTFRQILMETSPWLLVVTCSVSLLHTVFDFLAFKNDIKFWKGRKNVAGLSIRTITVNSFFQLVIFLYLLDNQTSWMVLISNGVGLLIEFWKITKALKVDVVWRAKIPVWIQVTPKESYVNSNTKEYDDVAMNHLFYIIFPLIAGYSGYSLFYGKHKSWYSWVLSSIVSFIYMFGFIMMTPQLFINYKMKSVAHLPWRVMVYKSLNTFIDDLFAFIIKMPMMHRLACLRDDVIFFIFLYQKWIYPIDKSRVNEYGQIFEDADQTKQVVEPIESSIPEEKAAASVQVLDNDQSQMEGVTNPNENDSKVINN